ncbi:MAG: hypothetical protein KDK60_03965 [Chlamydiia bacterium]|nr:hypothetical protein [Chlamydiia bacterium]
MGTNVVNAAALFRQEAQIGVIDSLHEKMHKHEVHTSDQLSQTIDTIYTVQVEELSFESRGKFQSLCGRVHSLQVNNLIDKIVDESHALCTGKCNSPEELAQRTTGLKIAIQDIWQSHSLSKENSQLLHVAAYHLNLLTYSSKNGDVVISQKNLLKGREMLPKSPVKEATPSPDWDDAELAFDLLELAQNLFQGKVKEATVQFRKLPSSLQCKMGKEEEIYHNPSELIQRLVQKAYAIGREDGYVPSSAEILMMLEEAASYSQESE